MIQCILLQILLVISLNLRRHSFCLFREVSAFKRNRDSVFSLFHSISENEHGKIFRITMSTKMWNHNTTCLEKNDGPGVLYLWIRELWLKKKFWNIYCGSLKFNVCGIHYSLMERASRKGRKQPNDNEKKQKVGAKFVIKGPYIFIALIFHIICLTVPIV